MSVVKKLSTDDVNWFKANHHRLSFPEMQDVLNITREELLYLAKEVGVKLGSTCPNLHYANAMADGLNFKQLIDKTKRMVKEGSKMGPYTVVKPYTYHCLVLNKFGARESLTYSDLARYFVA